MVVVSQFGAVVLEFVSVVDERRIPEEPEEMATEAKEVDSWSLVVTRTKEEGIRKDEGVVLSEEFDGLTIALSVSLGRRRLRDGDAEEVTE